VSCNTGAFGDLLVTGLILGSIYALIALGYTMVYGVLKLINFAHDSIFMIGGASAFYILGTWLSFTEPKAGIALLAILGFGLLASGLSSASAAVLLERFAYRPLRKRGAARLAFLIAAVGASFFITYMFQQEFLLGTREHNFPQFMATSKAVTILGAQVNNRRVLAVLAAIALFIFLDFYVRKTRTGRSIRAVAQDMDASRLMGVNVDRVIVTTFFVGGFFGGIAGFLYGLVFSKVAWNLGFIPGIKAFTAAVLGGIGNIRGALLGGLTLGLVENLSTLCVGTEWKNPIAFGVLVLVLVFRPTGMLGEGLSG
jgi:branched-chain amino acid transport system permease protein